MRGDRNSPKVMNYLNCLLDTHAFRKVLIDAYSENVPSAACYLCSRDYLEVFVSPGDLFPDQPSFHAVVVRYDHSPQPFPYRCLNHFSRTV